jgi:hypothetical protein
MLLHIIKMKRIELLYVVLILIEKEIEGRFLDSEACE